MNQSQKLQPERVFYYFEQISQIPRGSGNTRAISDYCVAFAQKQGLSFVQDEVNNVVIFKSASKGHEQSQPVILQGHLDMVCEKNLNCDHDFEQDGITLIVENGRLHADQTTLGADNGIAIAFCLALLEDQTACHPALEVVFTVDEEIGMDGAKYLDTSILKGTRMLNLDSDEEGILITSCAGGVRCKGKLPVTHVERQGNTAIEITVLGLMGGHSGMEIDKGRCNANKLMGRLLFELSRKLSFEIVSLCGGQKDNAIPREAKAVIFVDKEVVFDCTVFLEEFEKKMKRELGTKEPELHINVKPYETEERETLHPKSKELLIFLLMNVPDGVQEMSGEIKGLVETSLNLGVMNLEKDIFTVEFALRSSVQTAKEALRDKVICFIEFLGGECVASDDYPAWEYKKDSALRNICLQAYEQLYGRRPEVEAVHAGLECGILADKIKDLDCISFGADLHDIHTPLESLSVSSVKKTWDYLLRILSMLLP